MTKGEMDEMEYFNKLYGYDGICWEGNIIDQIRRNEYGWFDFSKSLVDIGAGAGEYPIFSGFRHSYAFEPNKVKQCLIYANMLSHDKYNDIEVLPYAISDNPGIREFSGWTENVQKDCDNINKCTIEYRTLDSFNLQEVGMIKVDIEGYELFALRSGIGTIIRNDYPPLLIELWSDSAIINYMGDDAPEYKDRRDKLLSLLLSLGYIHIINPNLGDWETFFFIHNTHLNGYIQ
jgi:FkbM family methyltransferase